MVPHLQNIPYVLTSLVPPSDRLSILLKNATVTNVPWPRYERYAALRSVMALPFHVSATNPAPPCIHPAEKEAPTTFPATQVALHTNQCRLSDCWESSQRTRYTPRYRSPKTQTQVSGCHPRDVYVSIEIYRGVMPVTTPKYMALCSLDRVTNPCKMNHVVSVLKHQHCISIQNESSSKQI